MVALGIILVLLILLLLLPVGVDVSYDGALAVRVKIGPLKFTLIPSKPKKERPPKAEKQKKQKKPSLRKIEKQRAKKKLKLTVQDILDLVRIGLQALGRFRRSLSIDLFRLHILVAADDPYDAVMRYGALNAGLGTLSPAAHTALKFRREDVRTDVDVQGAEGSLELQIIATLQIWEILRIALCGGFSFLSWYLNLKKAEKARTEINQHTQEEKAS